MIIQSFCWVSRLELLRWMSVCGTDWYNEFPVCLKGLLGMAKERIMTIIEEIDPEHGRWFTRITVLAQL